MKFQWNSSFKTSIFKCLIISVLIDTAGKETQTPYGFVCVFVIYASALRAISKAQGN